MGFILSVDMEPASGQVNFGDETPGNYLFYTPLAVMYSDFVLQDLCIYIVNNNNRIQSRSSRFFTISLLRREPSPTRTLKWPGRNRVQITCNTSSAYHVQHVVLLATWYEGTAQL